MPSLKKTFKAVLGLSQIWRLVRYMNRHRVAILMYHGLTKDDQFGDWVHVREAEFVRQMDYLRSKCNPISLATMLEMFEHNDVKPNSVVVTFDDGYKSIATLAAPILAQYDIPHTVFLTSGFITDDANQINYLWADRVLMLAQSGHSRSIDLSSYELSELVLGDSPEAIRSAHNLVEALKLIDNRTRLEVIDHLEQLLSANAKSDRFVHCLPMNWDDARLMAGNQRTTIGSHTMSHPILSRLDNGSSTLEIAECRKEIESRIDTEIRFFAYPNGRIQDIGQHATEVARQHYQCALTTRHGLASASDNLWSLPRIGVGRDMPLSIFRQLVAGLF